MLSCFTRKNILPLLTLVLFLSLPSFTFAHTGFESSNPKNGEIVTTDLTNITLNFEGKVENLSTFQLLTKENKKIDLAELKISEKTMIGTLSTPLSNGDYQVQWTIVGADGHPIKGQFAFTVNRPTSGNSESTPPKEEIKKTDTGVKADPAKADSVTPPSQNDKQEKSSYDSYILYGVIAIVIIAGFILVSTKRRK